MSGRLYILVSMSMSILLAPVSLAVDVTYFKTVNLTYIPSAVKNGAGIVFNPIIFLLFENPILDDAVSKLINFAVCLDGSPPAYHIDRGVGEGALKWLVFIEVSSYFLRWSSDDQISYGFES